MWIPRNPNKCVGFMASPVKNVNNNRQVVDLSNSLYLLNPTQAPLWVLVDRLNKQDCVNPKIEWLRQTTNTAVVHEFNYCQIFRKNVEVTKSFVANRHYTAQDRSYMRKKKGIEMLRDFECAMMFGIRQQNPNIPIRQVGGISFFNKLRSTISQRKSLNIKESDFEILLREVFRYGAAYRSFFCGFLPKFMQPRTNKKSKCIIVPRSKSYGIPVTQYLSLHGTLNIVEEPIFNDFGVFVDLSSLVQRPLAHRSPTMLTNTHTGFDDFVRDTYIAEWSLELHAPEKGAIIGTPGIAPQPVREGSPVAEETMFKPTLDEILGMENW